MASARIYKNKHQNMRMRAHPITGVNTNCTQVSTLGAPMGANFVAANDGVVVKAGPNTCIWEYGNNRPWWQESQHYMHMAQKF